MAGCELEACSDESSFGELDTASPTRTMIVTGRNATVNADPSCVRRLTTDSPSFVECSIEKMSTRVHSFFGMKRWRQIMMNETRPSKMMTATGPE